jgi:hypothetical protein
MQPVVTTLANGNAIQSSSLEPFPWFTIAALVKAGKQTATFESANSSPNKERQKRVHNLLIENRFIGGSRRTLTPLCSCLLSRTRITASVSVPKRGIVYFVISEESFPQRVT